MQNLDVHTDQANDEFDISGQASVTVGGNTLNLTLGNTTTPGLVIANGDLQSLLATVTPPAGSTETTFMFHGLSVELASATFSYDQANNSFGIGADASVMVAGQTVEVTLGSDQTPGIVIQNGALASFDGSITTDIEVHGLTFKTEDLAIHYASTDPNVTIKGAASFEFEGQKLEVALGSTGADGTSHPGLVINPNTGALISLDAAISTDITIGEVTIKVRIWVSITPRVRMSPSPAWLRSICKTVTPPRRTRWCR